MPTRSSFLGWYLRRRNGCFFGVTPEAAQEYVTIEDITAEADVSLRTFGNYFSSKYEAICTIGTDRARRIGATLLARPAGEPLWEAISNAVLADYEGTGQALVEAIAARTGTDLEQVAVRRWSAADPPVPLGPLLRRALEQLATACSGVPDGG